MVDLQDYGTELKTSPSDAWPVVRGHITCAQEQPKQRYDKHAKESPVKDEDRVMVHMPGSVKEKAWKLVRLHIEQSL